MRSEDFRPHVSKKLLIGSHVELPDKLNKLYTYFSSLSFPKDNDFVIETVLNSLF